MLDLEMAIKIVPITNPRVRDWSGFKVPVFEYMIQVYG
jgi:hypothetical protein